MNKEFTDKMEALGFQHEMTGGGCTAWVLHDDLEGRTDKEQEILITDGEAGAPQDYCEAPCASMHEDGSMTEINEEAKALVSEMLSINSKLIEKGYEPLTFEQVKVFLGLDKEQDRQPMLDDMRDRMGVSLVKKGQRVFIKKVYQDKGEEGIEYRAVEDEEMGKVMVMAMLGLPINPLEVIETSKLEA